MDACIPLAKTATSSPPEGDLARLVRELQRGEHGSFDRLVENSERLARRLALPVVGPDLVEDVLQESYLIVYRKVVTLREPERFNSWFSRIVLHTAYDVVRKQPRLREISEELPDRDATESVLSGLAVRGALAQLERKDRNILILREMLEFDYEQIADTLRLKVGTVRSRLHAARKHLADRLNRSKH